MTYFRHVFLLALLVSGCDSAENPVATITGIDVEVSASDEFIEINDVAGRPYIRVESFPASVDLQLWSEGRDYFVVLYRRTADGIQLLGTSDSFKATDLVGATYTTNGDVRAVLTLE